MIENLLPQKLAEWRPNTTRQTLTLEDDSSGWRLDLQADAVDTIGGRFWEVVLKRTQPQTGSCQDLKLQAEALASRVTGLLEPLRLVEVDGDRKLAQMRSQAPARRGETLHYYEVLRAENGETTLRRYKQEPNEKRQVIAFTMTHETLVKLVGDLMA